MCTCVSEHIADVAIINLFYVFRHKINIIRLYITFIFIPKTKYTYSCICVIICGSRLIIYKRQM